MIAGDNSGFPYNQHHGFHIFGYMDDFNQMLDHPPPLPSDAALELEVSAHLSGTLVYNLSVLRSKVEQVDAMVNVLAASPNLALQPAAAGASSILQEIIVAASSMMMALEQLGSTPAGSTTTRENEQQRHTGMLNAGPQRPPSPNVDVVVHVDRPYSGGFFGDHHDIPLQAGSKGSDVRDAEQKVISAPTFMDVAKVEPSLDDGVSYGSTTSADRIHHEPGPSSSTPSLTSTCDVIELNAADLLAKYTHYCHICGKGFKRDANLRMHMRAHGDEYKTAAALSKSTPRITTTTNSGGVLGGQLPAVDNQGELASSISQTAPRKYSCPQEGCRWNKGHARFQPLKSMICVKNHYRRSHCPKMYVCNRCNKKRFSVLSDLRTHEKHCGDLKWRCSCGTTFSRKDKLMGHVALFAGHAPADCHQLVMDNQKQRLQQ